jgi:RNA polymerase sigma-70 factor (ECF subfamily)
MGTRERNIEIKMDKRSFEELFRSFFPSLVLFAQKYVPDQDTAKEIVHNVFINLWEKRQQVDTGSPLKSYLFTSVHNRCLNYIRDQKKFDKDDTIFQRLDSTDFSDGVDRLEEQELEQRIYDALQSLPEKCREIFMMNRFDGLKYAEIAEKQGISVKTVETQMSKALKILREKLIDYLGMIILFILTHPQILL